MLLFNQNQFYPLMDNQQFKYIPCYCSTLHFLRQRYGYHDLNTSHVTVQPQEDSASKMASQNLNTSHVTVQLNIFNLILNVKKDLNTSHVTVQLSVCNNYI